VHDFINVGNAVGAVGDGAVVGVVGGVGKHGGVENGDGGGCGEVGEGMGWFGGGSRLRCVAFCVTLLEEEELFEGYCCVSTGELEACLEVCQK